MTWLTDPNSIKLVSTLESLPLLDGRYSGIKCVNRGALERGCFSLVFCAWDTALQQKVAIKFYDPAGALDMYRLNGFHRENDILKSLIGFHRCLQLQQTLKRFDLPLGSPTAPATYLPCEYFVVEWLDQSIEQYFQDSPNYKAIDKLKLFNEIALSLEALHRHDIFHRDIKPDNMRAYMEKLKRVVVLIDLGTAARINSGPFRPQYGSPAGATPYAAPEAICGLAANRQIANKTDSYALGCLLWELFNSGLYFRYLLVKNPHLTAIFAAMSHGVIGLTDEQSQIDAWNQALARHTKSVITVPINENGSSVPVGVIPQLEEIVSSLTDIDYRKRMPIKRARHLIWIVIRILESDNAYKARLALNEKRRIARRAKIANQIQRALEKKEKNNAVN